MVRLIIQEKTVYDHSQGIVKLIDALPVAPFLLAWLLFELAFFLVSIVTFVIFYRKFRARRFKTIDIFNYQDGAFPSIHYNNAFLAGLYEYTGRAIALPPH